MNKLKNDFVFYVSVILSIAIVIVGLTDIKSFTRISNQMLILVEENFAWAYLLIVTFFIVFCLYLAFGKYGSIRLGPDDSTPEYGLISWFAMLFCAGMGVGLVFWGISEPLSHFTAPITGIEAGTAEAAAFAIRSSFMHWGIHPWATYAVVGLGLAYFQFRRGMPALMSSIFLPTLGEKGLAGPSGKLIDIFSVVVSVAGVATSLGMGCLQICAGLHYLYGIPNNVLVWLIVTVIICVIYLLSTVSGLNKGIKLLSDFNLFLAVFLLIICFLIGPSREIITLFTTGLGDYLSQFINDSFHIDPYGDNDWTYTWRIFYWAWWISWAPFVGIFIARISKGRTIREFVTGVILVPTIASLIWFSVFGGMALHTADFFSLETLTEIAKTPETTLFIVLGQYPFGKLLSFLSIILLTIFFITSAESATYVLGELTSKGSIDPPNSKKIIWGILQAAIAFILMVSGGVKALQTASIAASLPFAFIMLAACFNILRALKEEYHHDSVPSDR